MSLGGPGGSILAGPTKIGSANPVTIPATTWTEIPLFDLTSNPRPYPRIRYSLVCLGDVFLAQANHGLTDGQTHDPITLPIDPTIPLMAPGGFGAGWSFLLAKTYLTFEAERLGENSLWIYSVAGTTAYLTNLSYTDFDNGP